MLRKTMMAQNMQQLGFPQTLNPKQHLGSLFLPPPAFVERIYLWRYTLDTDAVSPTSLDAEVADGMRIHKTLLVPYGTILCLLVLSGPSLSVSAPRFLHLANLLRCQTLWDAKPFERSG